MSFKNEGFDPRYDAVDAIDEGYRAYDNDHSMRPLSRVEELAAPVVAATLTAVCGVEYLVRTRLLGQMAKPADANQPVGDFSHWQGTGYDNKLRGIGEWDGRIFKPFQHRITQIVNRVAAAIAYDPFAQER